MAKIRSHVVSRASCAVVSRSLELGERLLRGSEALQSGEVARLAQNRNVLAALLEAALAALYLEHGFEQIAAAIVAAFDSQIEFALTTHVDVAEVTDVEHTDRVAHRKMLLDDAGVLDRHLPAAELRQLGAEPDMPVVQG